MEHTGLVVGGGHGCRRSLSMMDYRSVKSRTDLEWSSLSENPSAVCGSGDLQPAGSGIFGIFQSQSYSTVTFPSNQN